jgi:phage baseplate assembly protein W
MSAIEYTAYTDAESVNNSKRSTFIYKDLNLYFTRNPVTSDVSIVTDVQDIKRAVRNIVLLNPGEKPFHPEIGTGIRGALFENFTPPILQAMRDRIEAVVRRYEPRVTVQSVSFNDPDSQGMDNNELRCQISFVINNAPQIIEEVDLMLQRVR